MTRHTKIKAEEKIPITGQGYTLRKLLDGTEWQILLDMGASKSYMSKSYYLRCKICFQYTENTGQKLSICSCTVCDTSDYRHTWPQS